jgi:hypothetical protein
MKHRAMRRLFRKMHGRTYEWMYRAAMGSSAVGRLVILTAMFPFGDRASLKNSVEKWKTVLMWALGFQSLAIQDR